MDRQNGTIGQTNCKTQTIVVYLCRSYWCQFHRIAQVRATLAGCPHHLLCLRLLVFRGALFSVATPKKRGLFTRPHYLGNNRSHFAPLGAVQCINAYWCGSFSIRHTCPALSPPCGSYDSGCVCDWAKLRIVASSVAGGAPNPTQKRYPSGVRTRKLPRKPARVYNRWRCPRPCVYAWQRWRPPLGLSAPIVGLFRLAPRCGAGAVPQCGPPSIFCRGRSRGAVPLAQRAEGLCAMPCRPSVPASPVAPCGRLTRQKKLPRLLRLSQRQRKTSCEMLWFCNAFAFNYLTLLT